MDSIREEEIEEITSENEVRVQTNGEAERETASCESCDMNINKNEGRISRTRWCNLFCGDNSQDPHVRVHQTWPGNNVIFFKGMMICGPDPKGFALTVFMILVCEWIFAFYVSDFSPRVSTIISSVSYSLTIIVIVTLFLVGTSDPGIIPRNKEKDPKESGKPNAENKSRKINVDGIEIEFKQCKICDLFTPPRSSHCSVCDNCVEKFDHHCPWIGTCIGLRNYRYYLMFIFSLFIYFLYVFAISTWRITTKMTKINKGFFALIFYMPEIYLLAIFSLAAIWFLGALLGFHAYLISINQTSRERLKEKYINSPNPYDKGAIRNIKEVLFAKLPTRRFKFRDIVVPPKSDVDEEDPGNNSSIN